MRTFFAMGGYAAFVWPAYAISLAGVLVAIFSTVRSYRRAKARLRDLEQKSR